MKHILQWPNIYKITSFWVLKSAVPKALWKWGVYFNIFPNFLAISEKGGVTKIRPIDPFFHVIYLFLNAMTYILHVSFGTFCRELNLFLLHFDKLFWWPFLFFFSAQPLSFPSFTPLKFFCPPKKLFPSLKTFYTPLKIFQAPYFLLPSLTTIFRTLQKVGGVRPKKWGVLTPKIPPASAPLYEMHIFILHFNKFWISKINTCLCILYIFIGLKDIDFRCLFFFVCLRIF